PWKTQGVGRDAWKKYQVTQPLRPSTHATGPTPAEDKPCARPTQPPPRNPQIAAAAAGSLGGVLAGVSVSAEIVSRRIIAEFLICRRIDRSTASRRKLAGIQTFFRHEPTMSRPYSNAAATRRVRTIE